VWTPNFTLCGTSQVDIADIDDNTVRLSKYIDADTLRTFVDEQRRGAVEVAKKGDTSNSLGKRLLRRQQVCSQCAGLRQLVHHFTL
jgi:hypothetical protein